MISDNRNFFHKETPSVRPIPTLRNTGEKRSFLMNEHSAISIFILLKEIQTLSFLRNYDVERQISA